jgi:hypothetical protein
MAARSLSLHYIAISVAERPPPRPHPLINLGARRELADCWKLNSSPRGGPGTSVPNPLFIASLSSFSSIPASILFMYSFIDVLLSQLSG